MIWNDGIEYFENFKYKSIVFKNFSRLLESLGFTFSNSYNNVCYRFKDSKMGHVRIDVDIINGTVVCDISLPPDEVKKLPNNVLENVRLVGMSSNGNNHYQFINYQFGRIKAIDGENEMEYLKREYLELKERVCGIFSAANRDNKLSKLLNEL